MLLILFQTARCAFVEVAVLHLRSFENEGRLVVLGLKMTLLQSCPLVALTGVTIKVCEYLFDTALQQ